MPDHERIWLEPGDGDPSVGRLWCKDDVWTGDLAYEGEMPTEYVRADIHAARVAELELQANLKDRIVAWLREEVRKSRTDDSDFVTDSFQVEVVADELEKWRG
jgi:hypothetical protein